MIQAYQLPNNKISIRENDKEIMTTTNSKWVSLIAYRNHPEGRAPKLWNDLRHYLQDQWHPEQLNVTPLSLEPTAIISPTEALVPFRPLPEILAQLVEYRRKDMEILICVAASDKNSENPVWLGLVAASSTGKTFLEEMLDHSAISTFIDEVTLNGLAAGKASIDAADNANLFEFVQNKNLIMNDMSSMLTLDEKQVYKFMGAITAAYGQRYRKWSPGGLMDIQTGFSLIMGMTHHLYKKQRKLMSILGSRLLFHKMKRPEDMRLSEDTRTFDKDEMRLELSSLVRATLDDTFIPDISPEVDDYLYEQTKIIIRLRQLRWASNIHELEGESRLYQQLKLIAKTRAKIYHREVLKEDIDFFLILAVNTIPYTNNLKNINDKNNKWTVSILKNAKYFGAIEVIGEVDVGGKGFSSESHKELLYGFIPSYQRIIDMIDFDNEGDQD